MIQLLTAVHVVTNIGNKGDIHRNLKNYDSKTLKHPGKSENIKLTHCMSCRKQFNIIKKGPHYCKILLLKICIDVQICAYLDLAILNSESELNRLSFS